MNITNFIKTNQNGFDYLDWSISIPDETKITIKSNLQNNYQFFLNQQIPAILLNGFFKKYYKLTDREMLFIFLIISNKNTNLNDIKQNDFVFYNEYFKNIVSTDKVINETINNLEEKGMIKTKQREANGKNKGRYIDFSNLVSKFNFLFNKMITEKNDTQKQEKEEISKVAINCYLKNVRENFNFKNGKVRKSFQTHEKEKAKEINEDDSFKEIINNFPAIPIFLSQNLEAKNEIENENKSPFLYFMKHYEEYKTQFHLFLEEMINEQNEIENEPYEYI